MKVNNICKIEKPKPNENQRKPRIWANLKFGNIKIQFQSPQKTYFGFSE